MSGPRRFVFYAVDGLGLGHVTRLLGIARALRRLRRDAEVLFLTSSEADSVIYREGFAAVKVPSKTLREQAGLGKGAFLRLAQNLTWSVLTSFDPDVLVVDTYPAGSFDELLPALRWRQKNVFVYREQRPEVAGTELAQATLRLYDRILVPHPDVEDAGPLPDPRAALAVGPVLIREKSELLDRRTARERLGLPQDQALVWAAFGGGGDPDAAASLEIARQAVATLPGARLVAGLGPLAREAPDVPGALTLARYPMLPYLPAFDAAVSSTGYNSAHELLFAGVPSVLVPFPRQIDDQHARALAFAACGAARVCTPLTVPALAAQLRACLEPEAARALRDAARKAVPKNGAEKAARALLDLG